MDVTLTEGRLLPVSVVKENNKQSHCLAIHRKSVRDAIEHFLNATIRDPAEKQDRISQVKQVVKDEDFDAKLSPVFQAIPANITDPLILKSSLEKACSESASKDNDIAAVFCLLLVANIKADDRFPLCSMHPHLYIPAGPVKPRDLPQALFILTY